MWVYKVITLIENSITIDEYLYLREQVGWALLSDRQAQMAIENSLYNVKAVDEHGYILGMGRIVGDGAVISYIQDLVVIPEAQGKGVGSMIIKSLINYVESIKEEGFDTVKKELKDWLRDTSDHGCGDDITVALAYFEA